MRNSWVNDRRYNSTNAQKSAGYLTVQLLPNIYLKEDRFYQENDDDNEDEDEPDLDRRGRFQQALEIALQFDSQGYRVSPQEDAAEYTPQELTAISWAAFCTEVLPELDTSYRIQALDCDDLFDRLKLATHMLHQKELNLKAKLQKAGLSDEEYED